MTRGRVLAVVGALLLVVGLLAVVLASRFASAAADDLEQAREALADQQAARDDAETAGDQVIARISEAEASIAASRDTVAPFLRGTGQQRADAAAILAAHERQLSALRAADVGSFNAEAEGQNARGSVVVENEATSEQRLTELLGLLVDAEIALNEADG